MTVLEAAAQPGGQLRLAARLPRRAELMGIVDWRVAELERLGASLRCNVWAEAADVLALEPDVVIVATGGLPPPPELEAGAELCVSSWDILAGDVKPLDEVLLYDDHGGHAGMSAAEAIATAGARLEVVSPERFFAPEMGGLNHVPYAAAFARSRTRVTINTRLVAVAREGNRLRATLGSDFADTRETRLVDQVVVEHGTLPLADLYEALRPYSVNGGAVDYDALRAGRAQTLMTNPDGRFRLWRIGDAVACRNVHAAVYDGLRYAKDA